MAASASRPMDECLCPVCCDFYSDPVILLCGHSFCMACIQEWWTQSGGQKCPVCMETFPMVQPPRNLVLRNLSASLQEEAAQRASRMEDRCETHAEKLKLFCTDHQTLICVVCRDAKDHKEHDCVPIDEAAADSKKTLETTLTHLRTKLTKFTVEKLKCDKMSAHIQVQAHQTEEQIKGEFQKLQQFLRAEESERITALRKEAKKKSQAMKFNIANLTAEISSLSDAVYAAETDLKATDVSFMLNYKEITQRAQCTLPDPETPSGALINEAYHRGNLLFHVWMKMKSIIQCTPFCMDSNTLQADWILSEDLTSLRRNNEHNPEEVPPNPERCVHGDVHAAIVFSSGTSAWDVEVDGFWTLGVISKTNKTKKVSYWACGMHSDDHITVYTPATSNEVKKVGYVPTKIRLQLEYDKGKLWFYDLNRRTYMHKMTCEFTGKIVPFFSGNIKLIPQSPAEIDRSSLTTPG